MKRVLFIGSLALSLAGCQAMNHLYDSVSRSGSSTPSSSTPMANVPSQPPPNIPEAPPVTPPKTSSSFVVYVGSMTPVEGYTQVQQKGQTVYVDPRQNLVFSDLNNALAVQDEKNNAYVNVSMSPTGAQKLASLSSMNIGKVLVITMSNELISILKIHSAINGGILQIPMTSAAEAQTLERRILDKE